MTHQVSAEERIVEQLRGGKDRDDERDLRRIFVNLAQLNIKVDNALSLWATVDRLEARVDALELGQARQAGSWSISKMVFDIIVLFGLAAIGAGVWAS